MGERTEYAPGLFSWVDLSTPTPTRRRPSTSTCSAGSPRTTRSPAAGVYTMLLEGRKTWRALSAGARGAADGLELVRDRRERRRRRRRPRAAGRPAGWPALRRRRTPVAWPCSPTRNGAVVTSGSRARNPGARPRQRAGGADDEPAQHDRPGPRTGVLRGPVRVALRAAVEGDQPYWGVYNGDRLNAGDAGGPAARRVAGLLRLQERRRRRRPHSGARRHGDRGRADVGTSGRFLVAEDPQGGCSRCSRASSTTSRRAPWRPLRAPR